MRINALGAAVPCEYESRRAARLTLDTYENYA